MVVTNATGCSSVWGGNATFSPWYKDSENRGPSWARSLYENAAEVEHFQFFNYG